MAAPSGWPAPGRVAPHRAQQHRQGCAHRLFGLLRAGTQLLGHLLQRGTLKLGHQVVN